MTETKKIQNDYRIIDLGKRLFWDLRDRHERKYYAYWLIAQIPCLFGNMLRGRFLSRRFKSAGTNLTVYAGARFRSMEKLVVGDNVVIGYDTFIQAHGGVTFGDNVVLAPGVKIWSVNHGYKDKTVPIHDQEQIKAPVVIGNDVLIASNAFISPGVHIADGTVIAAGSVVGVKKYPAYCIVAGNPARVIGYREDTSVEHGQVMENSEEITTQKTG